MIKPKRLYPGARIAVISPSSGLPHAYPDIYELGLNNIREMLGLEIVEMPTARMSREALYQNPQLRAEDINTAFADESIDGIITSIGGYESIRILPYLNTEIILRNPKWFMGFSDATTFLSYLNILGMVTFYGPSVMAGMAQLKHLPESFLQHLRRVLFSQEWPYTLHPYPAWSDRYKDWTCLETLGQCESFSSNEKGWTFLQGHHPVEGVLWGGCIEVLEFKKSTCYWPQENFWHGKVLFFETSEDKPSPMQVGYMLRNYGMQGVFQKIAGILFGRPKDYSPEEKEELNHIVRRILQEEFHAPDLPVVMDVDFGHTDPKLVIPLGCKVQLRPADAGITLLEDPFTNREV